jgi:hypothetical protein
MKEDIFNILQPLIGLPLVRILQVELLTSFLFGIEHLEIGLKEDFQIRFKFNIYVLCPWRLRGPEGIIIGFDDRFYELGDEHKPVIIQSDVDQSIKYLIAEKGMSFIRGRMDDPLRVIAVQADEVGGVQLVFNDGYFLEIFPDSDMGVDAWGYENFDTSESGD